MDWDDNNIRNCPHTEYKQDSLGNQLAGYGYFIGVAYSMYRELDDKAQMTIIEGIYGERRYTTEITLGNMARHAWQAMHEAHCSLWDKRANWVNARHAVGQFHNMSTSVPADRDSYICECFKEEATYITKSFQNVHRQKVM